MLKERRLALEREMGRAKSGIESEKTSVDGNILENLKHQLDIATKVNMRTYSLHLTVDNTCFIIIHYGTCKVS